MKIRYDKGKVLRPEFNCDSCFSYKVYGLVSVRIRRTINEISLRNDIRDATCEEMLYGTKIR